MGALVRYDNKIAPVAITIEVPTTQDCEFLKDKYNLTTLPEIAKTYIYKFASRSDVVRPSAVDGVLQRLPSTAGLSRFEIPIYAPLAGVYNYINSCITDNDAALYMNRRGIFCKLRNGQFDVSVNSAGKLTSGVFASISYCYNAAKGLELGPRCWQDVNYHIRISGEEPNHSYPAYNANDPSTYHMKANNDIALYPVSVEEWKELARKYDDNIDTDSDTNDAIYGFDWTNLMCAWNTSNYWSRKIESHTTLETRYTPFGATTNVNFLSMLPIYFNRGVLDPDYPIDFTMNSNDGVPVWSTKSQENWHYIKFADDAFTANSGYADYNGKLVYKVKFTYRQDQGESSDLIELYKKVGKPNSEGRLSGGSILSSVYDQSDSAGNPSPYSTYKYEQNTAAATQNIKRPLVSCWSDSIYSVAVTAMTKTALTAKAIKDYVDDCFDAFADYVEQLCSTLITYVTSSVGNVFSGSNITLINTGDSISSENVNINAILKSGITRIIKGDTSLKGTLPPIEDYTGYLVTMNIFDKDNYKKESYQGVVINEFDKIRVRQIIYPDDKKQYSPWTRVGFAEPVKDANGDVLLGYLYKTGDKAGEKVLYQDGADFLPVIDTLENNIRTIPSSDKLPLQDGETIADVYDTYAVFEGRFTPNPLYQDNEVSYVDRYGDGIQITWSDWETYGDNVFSADNITHYTTGTGSFTDIDINNTTVKPGIYRIRQGDNSLSGTFPPINDYTGFIAIYNIADSSIDEEPGSHIRQIIYPDDIYNLIPWTRVYDKTLNKWSDWSTMGGDAFAGESVGSERISNQIANYVGESTIINNSKININVLQKPGVYRVGTDGVTPGTYVLEGDRPPIMGNTDMGYLTVFAIDRSSNEFALKKRIRQCYYPDDPDTGSPMTRTGSADVDSILEFTMPVVPGWNMMAFPFTPYSKSGELITNPGHILKKDDGTYAIRGSVYTKRTGDTTYIVCSEHAPEYGYYLFCPTAASCKVRAVLVPQISIELPADSYSIVPIAPKTNSNIQDLVSSGKIDTIYTYVNRQQYDLQSVDDIDPLKAYWVHAVTACTLTNTYTRDLFGDSATLVQGIGPVEWSPWENMGGGLRRVYADTSVRNNSGEIDALLNVAYDCYNNETINLPDPASVPMGTKIGVTQHSGRSSIRCVVGSDTYEQSAEPEYARNNAGELTSTVVSSIDYIFECCYSSTKGYEWVLDIQRNSSSAISQLRSVMGRKEVYHRSGFVYQQNSTYKTMEFTKSGDITDEYSMLLYDHIISLDSDDISNIGGVLVLPEPDSDIPYGARITFDIYNKNSDALQVTASIANSGISQSFAVESGTVLSLGFVFGKNTVDADNPDSITYDYKTWQLISVL